VTRRLPLMKLRGVVAKNLRELRKAKGLSQEELADRATVDRNYVGMVERSENSVSVDVLEKLADALEVGPSEFFRLGD
jgi:transcriptional regulator with XRE-family HTH domain